MLPPFGQLLYLFFQNEIFFELHKESFDRETIFPDLTLIKIRLWRHLSTHWRSVLSTVKVPFRGPLAFTKNAFYFLSLHCSLIFVLFSSQEFWFVNSSFCPCKLALRTDPQYINISRGIDIQPFFPLIFFLSASWVGGPLLVSVWRGITGAWFVHTVCLTLLFSHGIRFFHSSPLFPSRKLSRFQTLSPYVLWLSPNHRANRR